jgi:hypothetical protein
MANQVTLQSRNAVNGAAQSEYDAATNETIVRLAAAILDEDFIGPGHSSIPAFGSPATGYPWVQRTVKTSGSPTVAIIANSSGGIVQNALDATSEKQEASLYANDQLNWDMTKYATYETRAAASVLPTLLAVGILGLHSAWIDGPTNAAAYAHFSIGAAGLVSMQMFDGTTTTSGSTGVNLVAGVFHSFRIDASDPTNLRFFIDGTEYSTKGQLAFAGTGAIAILQPYASVYKASGAGLASIQLDTVQVSMNRT